MRSRYRYAWNGAGLQPKNLRTRQNMSKFTCVLSMGTAGSEYAHSIDYFKNASHIKVIRIDVGKEFPAMLLQSNAPGYGGGVLTRKCKELDLALNLVLKAGKIWNNNPS